MLKLIDCYKFWRQSDEIQRYYTKNSDIGFKLRDIKLKRNTL